MRKTLFLLFLLLVVTIHVHAQQAPLFIDAQEFAVLGTTGVTNTDTTIVYANLGVTSEVLIGFAPEAGPGVVLSQTEINTEIAQKARTSALGVYDFLKNQTAGTTLAPKLGNGFLPVGDRDVTNGMVLPPGVYKFSDPNVLLTGTLRLSGLNETDAVFIFQIEGDLMVDPGSVMTMERGTQPNNVFFQIGGKLFPAAGGIPGGKGVLKGNFLVNNGGSDAGNAISLTDGASVEGRILALNGGVSLNDNTIFLPNIIEADLSIAKSASKLVVPLDNMVTYTITVNNYGPQEASNVRVLEYFPAKNLEFIDFTFSTTTPAVAVTYEKVVEQDEDEDRYIFKLGNLPLRAKVIIRIKARAIATSSKVVNKVTVISDTHDRYDSKNSKNNAEVTINVPVLAADLKLTKDVTKATKVGESIVYTVKIENLGPDKATNVKVNEFFPDDYLDMIGLPVATVGTYVGNALFIPEIEVGKIVTLTIKAKIIKEGRITNVAQISSAGQSDPTTSNNRDDAVTDAGVVPLANLEIIKTASTAAVVLGTNITYTLTARNLGTSDATGVTVTELLSADLKFVSAIPNDQYDPNTGLWAIGNLAVGASATLNVTATPQITGQVFNTAKIKGDQVDLVARNDSATATICVVPHVPVLAAGKREVCAGDIVAYSVDDINGITAFQYELPVGFTKISGSGSTIIVRVDTTAQRISEIRVVPINANSSCANGEPLVIRVNVNRPPAAPGAINAPAQVCAGSVQTFNLAAVSGADTYTWSVPGNWQIQSGQNTTSLTVLVGTDPGAVTVMASNGCGTGGTAQTASITPAPVPATPTITDQSGPCQGLVYAVTAAGAGINYIWTVPEGFTISAGQGTATIQVTADRSDRRGTVTVTAQNAQCSSVAATLEATAKAADANLTLPTAFTPNGDDKNETWVVDNLPKFPDNELQIVNRWGNEVYKTKNYQNNWRAGGLGEGTYFYVLRVTLCNNVNKIYRGYITVVR